MPEQPPSAPVSTPQRRLWAGVRIAVTVGLLAILLLRLDLAALVEPVLSARVDALLLLIAVIWAQRYLAGLRWWLLLRTHTPSLSVWPVVRITFASDFVGQFLPGTIGVEAVRIGAMARATGNLAGVVASVVMDRVLSMGALAVIVLIAIALAPVALPSGESIALASWVFLALAIIGGAALIHPAPRSLLRRLLPRAVESRLGAKARGLSREFALYRGRWGLLALGVALAFLFQSMRIVMYILGAAALDIDVPLLAMIVAVPVVIFLSMLPISLGGLGVRESAFMYLLGAAGVVPEQAVAMSLFVYAVYMLCRLPGAWVLAVGFGSPGAPSLSRSAAITPVATVNEG